MVTAAAAIDIVGCVLTAAAAAGLPPAPAVAPGIGIGTYNADTTPGADCTAGWLVHGADGQPGLLTAGHCFHGGAAAYLNATHGVEGIGRFVHHVDEKTDDGEGTDIAELGIGNYPGAPRVDTDTLIIGVRPVVAPVDDARLANGQILCHYGAVSGPPNHGPQCGSITYLSPSKVVFNAKNKPGDSGGPVYYRNVDGTATPVGILIGTAYSDGGAVAELIGPWLQRWNLTVDTTTPGGRAPVSFQPPR